MNKIRVILAGLVGSAAAGVATWALTARHTETVWLTNVSYKATVTGYPEIAALAVFLALACLVGIVVEWSSGPRST